MARPRWMMHAKTPVLIRGGASDTVSNPVAAWHVSKVRGTHNDVEARRAAERQRAILVNPELVRRIEKIRVHRGPVEASPEGYLRDQATLPISPAPEPSDTTVFEDPADPARKFYLPRYRLREQGGRYEVSISATDDGAWLLRAGIERFPAPELGTGVQGAEELPHTIAVFVRYGAGPSKTIERRVDFTESADDDKGVTVSARLTLAERDALVPALKSDAAEPRLIVRRMIEVAARVPPPEEKHAAFMVMRARTEAPIFQPLAVSAQPMSMAKMSMAKMAMIAAQAGGPIAAEGVHASIRVSGESAPIRPVEPGENGPPAAEVERYRTLERAFDCAAPPDPFVLDPSLHDYFYAGSAGAGTAPEFRRIPVQHPPGAPDAHFHAYFQDGAEPWVFYYLPDEFKLSRGKIEPYVPDMAVRISTPDGTLENAAATVDYDAEPTVDPVRLGTAAAVLEKEIPTAATAETTPELRPLQAKASLRLRVPAPGGATWVEAEDETIDLANGFTHSLTLPLDSFRELYGAAYSEKATSLFSGQVLVETGLSTPEAIPIKIRFADAEGDVLSFREAPGEGVVLVTMRNEIESPVRVPGLSARVFRGDSEEPAQIDGLQLDSPVELAPGAEAAFTVRPEGALPGDDPYEVVFDTSAVEVLPDPERILPLISDSSVPAEYDRQVEVMTMPELLGDPADPGSILLIHVEFKGGVSIKVSTESPSGLVQVRLPLMDLLVNRDVEGKCLFRQQIIRRNGARTEDPDWRETRFGLLVVPFA